MLNILSYYTPTGFTGTTRDQFQYSLRGTLGYSTPAASQNGYGVAAPGLSAQYYYNIVQPGGADKMDPSFRTWWTNPQVTLNLPNRNRQTSGFGNGANQYSIGIQDNNYIAIGRLGISVNPISATYLFRDMDPATGSTRELKRGLSVTFMDTAIGYWATPNLIVGVQGQYNKNAVSGSDLPRSEAARMGPAFTYLGFKESGFFVAGNYARDVYADNAAHTARKGNTYQIWLQKYFKGS